MDRFPTRSRFFGSLCACPLPRSSFSSSLFMIPLPHTSLSFTPGAALCPPRLHGPSLDEDVRTLSSPFASFCPSSSLREVWTPSNPFSPFYHYRRPTRRLFSFIQHRDLVSPVHFALTIHLFHLPLLLLPIDHLLVPSRDKAHGQ
jgi:hypothetical protein